LNNPNARLHDHISVAEYRKARMICDPINLLDASPTGDGAAALVLVPLDSLRSKGKPRVVVAGSTAATDSIAIHDRKDGLWLSAAYASAKKAYGQAGIQPDDIDL
jgi:acetyl-CoA C-acetyltransferase